MEPIENVEIGNYLSPEVIAVFAEINQSRSAFQIENFVLGQHDTEEMRFYQCVLELQSLYYSLQISALEVKKIEIEIQRLKSTGDEIDGLDAQIKQIELERTKAVTFGAVREFEILLKKFDESPKYTRQQIDEAQPEYWERRLTRQYELASATTTANQASHLDALIQIGKVEIERIEMANNQAIEVGA